MILRKIMCRIWVGKKIGQKHYRQERDTWEVITNNKKITRYTQRKEKATYTPG